MSTRVTQTSTEFDRDTSANAGAYLYVSVEGERCTILGARFELSEAGEFVVGNGPTRARTRLERMELPDTKVSREHCELALRFGRWMVRDLESKNGTYVNGERVHRSELSDGDVIRVGNVVLVFRCERVQGDGDLDLESNLELPGTTTLIPELADGFAKVAAVIRADVPVVLAGPTGSGKELLTTALHAVLGRDGPLVPVNCGSLPSQLVESELFGHRRGAFSGSDRDHVGLFARAEGGTLFLDEVGELPLPVQAKLLRALEERSVRPVGGSAPERIDVRVIAASNRDLSAMVEAGSFRADLYGRLAGFVLQLPSITDRREDFGAFIAHALRRRDAPTKISGHVLDQVMAHPWPGGARALSHAIRAAAALANDGSIRDIALPAGTESPSPADPPPHRPAESAEDQALRRRLSQLCESCEGNLAEVARQMGKDRKQIRRWVERLGLAGLVERLRHGG